MQLPEVIAAELRLMRAEIRYLRDRQEGDSRLIQALVQQRAEQPPQPSPPTDDVEWFDLRYCARRKGEKYDQLRNELDKQPRAGVPETYIAGRKHWSREVIEEWLMVGDDERDAYVGRFDDERIKWNRRRRPKGAAAKTGAVPRTENRPRGPRARATNSTRPTEPKERL